MSVSEIRRTVAATGLPALFMTRYITIGFLLSALFLAASEYIFLKELFAHKRALVLGLGIVGVVLACLFFVIFYNKYRKTSDDA